MGKLLLPHRHEVPADHVEGGLGQHPPYPVMLSRQLERFGREGERLGTTPAPQKRRVLRLRQIKIRLRPRHQLNPRRVNYDHAAPCRPAVVLLGWRTSSASPRVTKLPLEVSSRQGFR